MSVDLSGYKARLDFVVECEDGVRGRLIVNVDGGYYKHWLSRTDGKWGWVKDDGTPHTMRDECSIANIIGEMKLAKDITAADLDGMVIELDRGGRLFVGDGMAVVFSARGGFGTTCPAEYPEWFPYSEAGNPEKVIAAYAAELERRKNPPVEIVWQGEFDEKNVLLFGWCNVHGEKWLAIQLATEGFHLRHGREAIGWMKDVPTCEQYIRDHYASKDRAAEPA